MHVTAEKSLKLIQIYEIFNVNKINLAEILSHKRFLN